MEENDFQDDAQPICVTQIVASKENEEGTKNKESIESLFSLIKELRSEIKEIKNNKESGASSSSASSSSVLKHVETPVREVITKTPVRELKNPMRVKKFVGPNVTENENECEDIDDENEGELYEELNLHAELTDGCESNDELIDNHSVLDFSKLNYIKNSDEEVEEPLNEAFAKIIETSWSAKKAFTSIKTLYDKYKCPQNFVKKPPIVNTELWKLLGSWQRKSDIKFSLIQKSIKRAMNATLTIFEECQKDSIDYQKIAQTITDISALLGHSSHEISLKRRHFIRSVISPEYKDLCSPSQPMTDKLFGDDLPKLINELNITNKISNKNKNKAGTMKENYRYKPYNTNNNRRVSFLAQGRGNLPQRSVTWKKGQQHQQQK